eukprot:gnl/TRDRNA2_/TRDRNA2_189600_c0_seq1.p1 gnl/TRDRNA2_/TRDRNA2_189600_c0~~gnl/TRDRNA2_/TRDRNA2_189600_c0_seq1.p1  ORF type:complete len:574 (+),score=79.32 gnl/TRDRNA2_/TRDRNA2_189600_c0_seq1:73-1794(+)
MIYYDSHQWSTLLRIRGSVLPHALLVATVSAVLAYALKELDNAGTIDMQMFSVLSQGSIYSGFTFVLGFSLVFRTSQSYTRYWTAATSIHDMGSEWTDACGSLVTFVQISKCTQQEKSDFAHTITRLFSLMHAMALEEIASIGDETFPLFDIEGFNRQDLEVLADADMHGNKVHIVLCWIKLHIVTAMSQGLLNSPPPIITRAFQELGAGLVKFHNASQVVIWPFPFPYTQMNFILIGLYLLVTPVMISTWDIHPAMCAVFTYVSVMCMLGLDLIASELENPFGTDPNDLPVIDMQQEFNRNMLAYLHPCIWNVPRLSPTVQRSFHTLKARSSVGHAQLKQAKSQRLDAFETVRSMGKSMLGLCSMKKRGKMVKQMKWATQSDTKEAKASHIREFLRLPEVPSIPLPGNLLDLPSMPTPSKHRADSKEPAGKKDSKEQGERQLPAAAPKVDAVQPAKLYPMVKPPISAPKTLVVQPHTQSFEQSCESTASSTPPELQWDAFFEKLSVQFQQHLEMEAKQLGSLQDKHLCILEQLLAGRQPDGFRIGRHVGYIRGDLTDTAGVDAALQEVMEIP